ncbi:hypothetical protein HAZT_HAZT005453 [Hyalella azteca]|uniref:Uncharacterized protein n=1 Tax=Hyalella azteca TaxID=294128 RepID=A0A6A0H6Q2_HYAAZ|nr:hypothetical protein HAZT_HAZT005453 [Hyalella azteca]
MEGVEDVDIDVDPEVGSMEKVEYISVEATLEADEGSSGLGHNLPVHIRWNSTYDSSVVLNDLLHNKRGAVYRVMTQLKLQSFTDCKVGFLKEYAQVMSNVAKALDKIQVFHRAAAARDDSASVVAASVYPAASVVPLAAVVVAAATVVVLSAAAVVVLSAAAVVVSVAAVVVAAAAVDVVAAAVVLSVASAVKNLQSQEHLLFNHY